MPQLIILNGGQSSGGPRSVTARMCKLAAKRLESFPPGPECKVALFPVGLLFARGDRAGDGARIAEQVRASYQYWHKDSADFFDIVFPGWYRKGKRVEFSVNSFLRYRSEVERESKWRYSGETDFLLLNFEYTRSNDLGEFSFKEVIYLPVEEMLREGLVGSLDGLMNEIVNAAKTCYKSKEQANIWQISDRVGYIRGRKALWQALKDWVLKDFAGALRRVEPFVVSDMSP